MLDKINHSGVHPDEIKVLARYTADGTTEDHAFTLSDLASKLDQLTHSADDVDAMLAYVLQPYSKHPNYKEALREYVTSNPPAARSDDGASPSA